MKYVYVLLDPIDEKTCYVGKAKDVVARYNAHLNGTSCPRKDKWIEKLIKKGKKPFLYVIAYTDDTNAADQEKFWIRELHRLGFSLTNVVSHPRYKEYLKIERKKRDREWAIKFPTVKFRIEREMDDRIRRLALSRSGTLQGFYSYLLKKGLESIDGEKWKEALKPSPLIKLKDDLAYLKRDVDSLKEVAQRNGIEL